MADARRDFIGAHAGIRGVAALGVVCYHLSYEYGLGIPLVRSDGIVSRWYMFVDLFFILSGFVISLSAGSPLDRVRGLGDFAVARLARIYPLHLFCLVVLVLARGGLTIVAGIGGRAMPADWWSVEGLTALGLQLVLLNGWIAVPAAWNFPSWSISTEVAAYLAFPLLAVGLARRPGIAVPLLAAAILAFYGAVAVGGGGLDYTAGPWAIGRCLAGFGAGMLIYRWRPLFAALSPMALSGLQLAAMVVGCAAMALGWADVTLIPPFVLLVAATASDRGVVATALSSRLARWLGTMSYSIYLLHIVVIRTAGPVFGSLVTGHGLALIDDRVRLVWCLAVLSVVLSAAAVTFRFVERPARAWIVRRLRGPRAALRPSPTPP